MHINTSLHTLISTFKQDGDFATRGVLDDAPPLIQIEELGLLGYPITVHNAQTLRDASSPAPYGRGADTLLDESVRRGGQIEAARISLDASWQGKLDRIVHSACEGLGVKGKVNAQLYKMLVYESGGFFARHRDSEKQDRMFATLVIALPCDHEGGVLEVRHGSRTMQLDLATMALNEVHWAAFYTDCEHELHPVTRGMRVVLLYNLYRPTQGALPAPLTATPAHTDALIARESWPQ